MWRTVRLTAALLALATVAGCSAHAQQPSPAGVMAEPVPQVVSGATGEVEVVPDRASIALGVMTRAPTAGQAAAENARVQRAIIDTLRALGIAAEQIRTSNFMVRPEQSFDPRGGEQPRITGYVVENLVTVEVRDVSRVGRIVDAALSRGANTLHSLNFFSSREEEGRLAGLREAVRRARAEAEVLASAAGGTLGELLELSSTAEVRGPGVPYRAMALERADAASTPIEPGEQTVRASVVGRWRFVGGSR